MAKGEFDILYVLSMCWGRGVVVAMIFSFDKSTSLEGGGGSEKTPEMIRGGLQKKERKK